MASTVFTIGGIAATFAGVILYLVGQATIDDVVAGAPRFADATFPYLAFVFGGGVLLGVGTAALINAFYQTRRTPVRWRVIVSVFLSALFFGWGVWRVSGHAFLPLMRFGLFWYGMTGGSLFLITGCFYGLKRLFRRSPDSAGQEER